ncbi:rho GTPase-activating protein gacF, partial [Drosophila albomicans]|uniref:Rho GTPase-activating protein gacF n=1 Tax=Drosophila albomicans TaxID=7291 RepID=A0A6P8XR36_DROAB
AAAAAVMSTGNGIMANSVMSTPPDVILEVGPAPSSVRFVAHALVLGMHSGYLRSAIRMDEAAAAAAAAAVAAAGTTATVGAAAAAASGELLLYLGNVTAEQFAPLLTYMYTGYLDLNVDNIFAVLLATHVLHMPRALEICRSYLARSQTEGYLSGNASHPPPPPPPQLTAPKIIRPIASKATLPNFGFLPAPPPPAPPAPPQPAPPAIGYVDATAELSIVENNDEEEDIEVFIDSNTPTDNELDTEDCNVSVVSSLASSSAASSLNIERLDAKRRTPTPPPPPQPSTLPAPIAATAVKVAAKLRRSNSNNSTRKSHSKRGSNSSGLQIAKAPVPAVQLETAAPAATAAKFIIDVASCDGPVRFRRILNTAYGHKPDSSSSGGSSNSNNNCVELQRTQQSVSYSFHQQMARAISSQQRQQQLEENENSGDAATAAAATTVVATPATPATVAAAAPSQRKQSQAELFVCVYCKHTFKSQYCYQKHAKRHLNPLSLDKKLAETQPLAAAVLRDNATAELQLLTTAATPTAAAATTTTATAAVAAAAAATGSETATLTAAALLRREVRPLDMNVQYYPCKTCGSKFPSYYFVHKHRKLCHADELETTNNNNNNSSSSSNINNNNNNSNSSSSNISKRETTAATTATAATAETAP